jgi:biotin operon repressor
MPVPSPMQEAANKLDEIANEKKYKELLEAYNSCLVTYTDWRTREIPIRKFLMGSWFKEGGLGFVFGTRGEGKTWFLILLALCLSRGKRLEHWPVEGISRVLYIDGEVAVYDMRQRFLDLDPSPIDDLLIMHHQDIWDKISGSINLADPTTQKVLTEICVLNQIKVLILDNLSCLFLGLRENEADDWEKVKGWEIDLRRRGISIIIAVHAGKNSDDMRGTTRKADDADWVIKISKVQLEDMVDGEGCCFDTHFTKNRNARTQEPDMRWTLKPELGGRIKITSEKRDSWDKVLECINAGVSSCSVIAKDLGISSSNVSKQATRLEAQGLIEISSRGAYHPLGKCPSPHPDKKNGADFRHKKQQDMNL